MYLRMCPSISGKLIVRWKGEYKSISCRFWWISATMAILVDLQGRTTYSHIEMSQNTVFLVHLLEVAMVF